MILPGKELWQPGVILQVLLEVRHGLDLQGSLIVKVFYGLVAILGT
mgnify:CR=1 FL=1